MCTGTLRRSGGPARVRLHRDLNSGLCILALITGRSPVLWTLHSCAHNGEIACAESGPYTEVAL
jgi:hypothetical protein